MRASIRYIDIRTTNGLTNVISKKQCAKPALITQVYLAAVMKTGYYNLGSNGRMVRIFLRLHQVSCLDTTGIPLPRERSSVIADHTAVSTQQRQRTSRKSRRLPPLFGVEKKSHP